MGRQGAAVQPEPWDSTGVCSGLCPGDEGDGFGTSKPFLWHCSLPPLSIPFTPCPVLSLGGR